MALVNTSSFVPIANISVPRSQYYHKFQIIHVILVKCSFPYIFLTALIGLITNTSTVVLLSKSFITKNLKNKWTLIALALSDLLFNIALLIRVTHDLFHGKSQRLCVIVSFLSHLAELLSACYTVSFTIQRYTAVRYPLETVAQRRSSPIISHLLILLPSSIFCFGLTHRTTYIECQEELHLNWFIADALVSFVIPFSLISIFNILIVNYIRKHSRSPISVQSTLVRQKKRSKHGFKTYHRDETCDTDNNNLTNMMGIYAHPDETENLQMKCKTTEKVSSTDMKNRTSISSMKDWMTSDTSSNPNPSQLGFRSLVSSETFFQTKKSSSFDSFSYRSSGKSRFQSNDQETSPTICARTSQSIHVTRVLILVSTCFLILNAPAHLFVIALKIYTRMDAPTSTEPIELSSSVQNWTSLEGSVNRVNNETSSFPSSFQFTGAYEEKMTVHLFYIALLLTHWISYASYSINFFLYSFSGISFRTSLRQLIRKLRGH